MRRTGILLVVACIAGCAAGPEDQVVGIWHADRKLSSLPAIAFPGIEEREQTFFRNSQLQLRSDSTFLLGSGNSLKGKWSIARDDITLSPDKRLGGQENPLGQKPLHAHFDGVHQNLVLDIPTPIGDIKIGFRKTG